MFLSSYESSVDVKKRVSIPAPFRKSLGGEDSVYLWPSIDKPCIEGAGYALVEGYGASISGLDLLDPCRNALATFIMGEARPAKYDEGGRIVLDPELIVKAGIKDKVRFIGLGDRFQIWDPATFEAARAELHALALKNLNLLKAAPRSPGQAAAE